MPSHEVTEELFDSVVGLNFKGPFRLASQVAKRMYDGAGGVIINVSSGGALMPLPNVIPYGSSKAALNAMTRSLAAEYGPKVRVNTLVARTVPDRHLQGLARGTAGEGQQRPGPATVGPRRSSPPPCSSPARRRATPTAPWCASTGVSRSVSDRALRLPAPTVSAASPASNRSGRSHLIRRTLSA